MRRRDVLKSVVSASAGAGLVAASGPAQAEGAKTKVPTTNAIPTPFIVTRGGASLFYKDWGNGKPVVFVHSWALNSDMWQYQMIHLAGQDLRCVAYDSRGHGRSSDPGRGYDYDTLAADLAAVIERLNLREVTLVGHSMGCGVVVRYLSRHDPKRVARVALVSPSLPFLLKTEDNPDGVDKSVFERLRALLAGFQQLLKFRRLPLYVTGPQQLVVMLPQEQRLVGGIEVRMLRQRLPPGGCKGLEVVVSVLDANHRLSDWRHPHAFRKLDLQGIEQLVVDLASRAGRLVQAAIVLAGACRLQHILRRLGSQEPD